MPVLPNQQEIVTADTFLRGLWEENPVFVMLLGMCPVLAVTNSAINAIAMGIATTFVLVASGTLISLLRSYIPKQVRIATHIVIIATFVVDDKFIASTIGPVTEVAIDSDVRKDRLMPKKNKGLIFGLSAYSFELGRRPPT